MNDTNQVAPIVKKVLEYNDMLVGLPLLPLIFFGCVAAGYFFKAFPPYPNRWIPFGVMCAGILANVVSTPLNSWQVVVRAVFYGMIVGAAAWIAHRKWLSKLVDDDEFKPGDTAHMSKTLPGTTPGEREKEKP